MVLGEAGFPKKFGKTILFPGGQPRSTANTSSNTRLAEVQPRPTCDANAALKAKTHSTLDLTADDTASRMVIWRNLKRPYDVRPDHPAVETGRRGNSPQARGISCHSRNACRARIGAG